ncbi:MAG: hypothetical protein ACRDJC_18580, partial [Thermomicrobiales bacterium]
SGYEEIAAYAAATVSAVTWPVDALGVIGLLLGLTLRQRLATASVAVALLVYVLLTVTIAFVPFVAQFAPQLEPTRLMPLQRLLVIYLAAVTSWAVLDWLLTRIARGRHWASPVAAVGLSVVVLLVQTRALPGPPPDPASPVVPQVSLYPVVMSAQSEQFDLEAAVRAADVAARPGTALLVLGSALSWHQQLWAPLWTERPLYYDNWLWYWRPDHAGTPGYAFLAGHHYPDPERALEPSFLARHGIGGVVATGSSRAVAARSSVLDRVREGTYDAYTVTDPVTTVTFDGQHAAEMEFSNQWIAATAETAAEMVTALVNWHPRWGARLDGDWSDVTRRRDGYLDVASTDAATRIELLYAVQPLDWVARFLALFGVLGASWLIVGSMRRGRSKRRLVFSSSE